MSESLSAEYPQSRSRLPDWEAESSRYRVRFATSVEELHAIQRLRFQVFNLELGEGLEAAFKTGRDEDPFDASCHHLIATDKRSGEAVATYRVQTSEVAREGIGFYSAREFDLEALPAEFCSRGIELGRVCIAQTHRARRLPLLMWQGLAAYGAHNEKQYVFGCGSVPTRDPAAAHATALALREAGHTHPELHVAATKTFHVPAPPPNGARSAPILPPLFRQYFAMGARVCSEPALDIEFGTADFLLLFDLSGLDGYARPRATR